MSSRDSIDAGFEQIRPHRFLHAHLDEMRSLDFRRAWIDGSPALERWLAHS